MPREVAEWIGRTPDTPAPPRVKLRVLRKYENRCYLTGAEIRPGDSWDCDHIQPLINGGQNRESNLAPALKAPHKEKTKTDLAIKKKNNRVALKHFGIKKSRNPMPGGRGSRYKIRMDGSVVERTTGKVVKKGRG